jgi:hypothetical protein
MFQPKTLLKKKTPRRICKRQIQEWPQLELIQDRISSLSKPRSKCYNNNNYNSANKCFKWVQWVQCFQVLRCHSNRCFQAYHTCNHRQWESMYRTRLLRSNKESLLFLSSVNFRLNWVNFKPRLQGLGFHNLVCQDKLVCLRLTLLTLCFISQTKFSTMTFNSRRVVKRLHHRNHRLIKRITEKVKLELLSKLLKDNHLITKDLVEREPIQLFFRLKTYLWLELRDLEDQLKIHQLKTQLKMREFQDKNLVWRPLNLKKSCQRNQILKQLKEQLVLIDLAIELQPNLKFKMNIKEKL